MDFTLDDVVSKVREVAAERPDFVYQSLQTDPLGFNIRCFYRHGEKPGCIIGQALDRLDYVVPSSLEGENVYRVLDHLFGEPQADDRANWLRFVQARQDGGSTWGEAVQYADSRIKVAA